jgi:hypothetical protein
MVIFADGYYAGAHANFDGDKSYLIVMDGMTGFAAMEPVRQANAQGFAEALMRVLLRFGLCHTIVLDKDSKFFGTFRQVVDLLNLNPHVISGENHNAMLVERLNRFLDKGLRVMTNERESVRIAAEGILLLIYAWNSAPIPGTDLPRCLVAIGRVFHFPMDFSANKHLELTASPSKIESYAKDQATLLSFSRALAKVLLEEHRTYHRELINSRRPDPRQFEVGDIVFAKRATKSVASKGRVGKLMYPMTGPWKVIEKLNGASYRIEHSLRKGHIEKKHASMLSPYPLELILFEPIDGPDSRFGQINKPISKSPFIDAGINGFQPIQPFKLPINYTSTSPNDDFYWPSVSELNDELFPFPWEPGEIPSTSDLDDDVEDSPVMYHGPPPKPPIVSTHHTVPSIADLAPAIIRSTDRLFFISFNFSAQKYHEWRLVRVALEDSMSLHPSCLQDGRFIVEFYIPHAGDIRYNCINKRFWLQYHTLADSVAPIELAQTHLVKPSDTSEQYARRKNLRPLRQWVNLTHKDTYIHGPFEFASINGRKTRDRVSLEDWKILVSNSTLYDNKPPELDLPTYSIHVNRGVHCSFFSPALRKQLHAVASALQVSGDSVTC